MTRAYFASKRCKKRMLDTCPQSGEPAKRPQQLSSERCSRRSLLAVLDTQSARKAMELLVQDRAAWGAAASMRRQHLPVFKDQPVELSAVGDLVVGSVQRKGQIPETI